MNENQENTAAEPVEPSAAAEAPKKRRAPRKAAAEAQVADVAAADAPAPATEEAPKKRRAPRKTAVAAEALPEASAAPSAEPIAQVAQLAQVAPAAPAPAPAVVEAAAPVASQEPVLASAEPAAEDEAGEGGGRRGRNRRRGRRGERDSETSGADAASTNEDGEAIEEIVVAPDTGELDTRTLESGGVRFVVNDTLKLAGQFHGHAGKLSAGTLKKGDRVLGSVDAARRGPFLNVAGELFKGKRHAVSPFSCRGPRRAPRWRGTRCG